MPRAELSQVSPSDFTDAGGFVSSVRDQDLLFFCLNVGDGDTQLILLPRIGSDAREAVVVDVADAAKLEALIRALQADGLLADPPDLPLVVATHPHDDHIRGMGDFLSSHRGQIGDFWEPGFRTATPAYKRMMNRLAEQAADAPCLLQPTAGTTVWIGQARITALSPATGLRNRFDSYGVDTNDASISMRLEFPTSAAVERDGTLVYQPPPERAAIVLGADSQARSWAHVLSDFPKLERSGDEVAKALRKATGADHLGAAVFKVSHHCSNRGSWLELISEIGPRVCLITADPVGSQHGFPHMVALEGIREAMQATATSNAARSSDLELGIHVTGGLNTDNDPLGSIAVRIGPGAKTREVWRFGNARDEECTLANGQKVKDGG